MNKHEELRQILIDNNCPEIGDSIIDQICAVFGYPTTTGKQVSGPKLTQFDLEAWGTSELIAEVLRLQR